MKDFFEKNNKVFLILFRNLVFTSILIFVLDLFFNIRISHLIGFNFLIFFLFFFSSLWLLFCIRENEEKFKKFLEPLFKFLFLFFLILVTISSLDFEILKRFEILNLIIELLNHYVYYLTLLAVGSGFFTFYFNKERVEEEIEEESKASNWPYIVGLLLILLYASLLIYPNLGGFDFYHDESWHVRVIDSLSEGDGFYLRNYVTDESTTQYKLGYITNLGSYFSSLFFSNEILGARFFVATVSLVNLVIIYAIFKSYLPKAISLLITLFVSYNIIFLYLARFLRSYPVFLLSYLVTALCTIKMIKHFKEQNIKGIILNFCLIIIFTLIALSEREISKILFVNLGIIFFFVFVEYRDFVFDFIKKHKKKVFYAILFLIIAIVLLEVFNITRISSTPRQIFQQFSLSTFRNPTNIYYSYLFTEYTKVVGLNLVFVFCGIFYLILNLWKKKKNIVFLTFLIIPIFFNIYLLDRYEDFRYIYHIIPFASAISVLGLYALLTVFIKQKGLKIFLAFIFLIILLSYPMIPFSENSGRGFVKSMAEWQEGDGQKYLHRRAVPPKYSKVYEYLNENKEEGDIVIMNEAQWNIEPMEDVDYYSTDSNWSYTRTFVNFRDESEIDFFDLINETEQRMWYLGAYFHMIDHSINEYLLRNCENISEDLNIFKYNYNNYYEDRFYWPNLFLCE